jgi:hypothetical protein
MGYKDHVCGAVVLPEGSGVWAEARGDWDELSGDVGSIGARAREVGSMRLTSSMTATVTHRAKESDGPAKEFANRQIGRNPLVFGPNSNIHIINQTCERTS